MDNISVIIRNRNEERYIGYSIQSVLDFFDKPEIICGSLGSSLIAKPCTTLSGQ